MPKKLKLNLNELKVQSFVTSLDSERLKMVNGGGTGELCDAASGTWITCVGGCQTNERNGQGGLCSMCNTQCTGTPCTGGSNCPVC